MVSYPQSPTHPSIVYACFCSLFKLKMGLRALAERQGNTWDRSAVQQRLTLFLTCIHTCGKVKGCSQPGLRVFGLQERKPEHPEEKPCEVKSSLFVKPNITLNVSMGFTGSQWHVLDPVQALREEKTKTSVETTQ